MWKAGGSSFNSTLHLGNDGPPSAELTRCTGWPENVARFDEDIVSVDVAATRHDVAADRFVVNIDSFVCDRIAVDRYWDLQYRSTIVQLLSTIIQLYANALYQWKNSHREFTLKFQLHSVIVACEIYLCSNSWFCLIFKILTFYIFMDILEKISVFSLSKYVTYVYNGNLNIYPKAFGIIL